MNQTQLRGQTAIVTGASSGIGLEAARTLVGRGCNVALVARTKSKLDALAAELGKGALAVPLDVGDLEAVIALPKRVAEHFGGLHIVINNAGLHHRGDMLRHSPRALADMVNVNFTSPLVLTRAAADVMQRGVVVNVASLAGKLGVPGSATYSGTKAGLRFWALGAAEDLARRNIRICNVNPGPVDTGFFDGDIENVSALTFSQPMSTSRQVVDAILACIEGTESPMEIDLPRASGLLATAGYLVPQLSRALRPVLEKRGAKAKAAFRKRKGL